MIELIQSIELSNINLIKYNFEVFNPEEAQNGGSIEISCEVNLIENDDDKKFEMISRFKVRGFREDDELFNLEEEFRGEFIKIHPEVFEKSSKELQVEFCVSLMYPTLRENASYTLSKAGLGQVHIPFHLPAPDVSQVN